MAGLTITSDVQLKGPIWRHVIKNTVTNIFETQYMLFIICASIGIKHDKRLVFVNDLTEMSTEPLHSVPRNVLTNKKTEVEYIFNTAIISTFTEDLTLDERLFIAFGEQESSYPKMKLLEEFANYGVTIIEECLSEAKTSLEMLQSIKDCLENLMIDNSLDDIELEIE